MASLFCVAIWCFAGCAQIPRERQPEAKVIDPAPDPVVAARIVRAAPPRKADPVENILPPKSPVTAAVPSVLTEDTMYKLLVAEFAGRRGALDLSVANYLDLARETRHPELARRATTIAVFSRDNEAALEAAQIWAEAAPDDMEARQLIVAMHVRAGDVDKALANLEEMLARDPDSADQNLRMVTNFLSREEEKETALQVMQRLVDTHPDNTAALLAYATLAIRANQLPRARAAMDRLVATGEIDAMVALSYLSVLQQQGEQASAISWLEQVLADRPDNFELRLIYARLLADARKYEQAYDQFVKLSQAQPEHADVLFTLGLISLQLNRVDEASGHFTKLVGQGQGYLDQAHFYLGQIAESRNATDEALQHYRRVHENLDSIDSFLEAQLRIAFLLARNQQLNEARAQLHGVRPRNEAQHVQLLLAEGEILSEHDRYQEAMAVYDAALEESYNKNLLYARAMLAEKIDRIDILEADLRTIIAREPEDAEALNALGFTLADRTDRYQEAYQLIARALQLDDSKFHILDSMGWVLYRMGRLQEAVDYLKKAHTLRNDPEVAAHLGEVLWVMGDKDGARNVLDSALQATPDDRKLLDVIERLRR